ncbi:MAG TPA: transaldolase family protein [Candidatus Polarisedimenticolia bacterium]|nr:transaldolase family protein [Candidatus Polarisedimenticolia bacterium]
MKMFIDSADPAEIKEALSMGVADGVTTNPTLIAKSGVRDLEPRIREIAKLVSGPVNVEVTAATAEGIVEEGRRFVQWGKNVHVKIPLNRAGLVACSELARQGIPSTMTLVFSPGQAILAARAGAAWICPFVGRLDDVSFDGPELIRTIMAIYDADPECPTRVLAASVRGPVHVIEAALAGAHAVTVPFSVVRQMEQHPLTDRGIAQFLADAAKAPHSTGK